MTRAAPILALLILAAPALGDELTGKVVGISDGDTITVLDETKTQHKIRLAGIDTPEKKYRRGSLGGSRRHE